MSSQRRDFKDTQLFGWESEPSETRSSEFAQSTGYSTGYSALSGYHVLPESRHKQKAKGLGFLLVVSGLIVGLGAAGLYWLAQFLRA